MMEHIVVAVGIGMALVFGAGVAVGIVVVIAMSARRAHEVDRADPPPDISRVGWPYLGEPDPDEDDADEPPWQQARGDD
jgi:hypothetical protein